MRIVHPVMIAVLTLPWPVVLRSAIIHVPGDAASIQAAIDLAVDGDSVLVAPGTYAEHDIDFHGKAITVTGTDPADSLTVASTVVDAGDLGRVFVFYAGEDSASVLAGLTIRGGGVDGKGAGIWCRNNSSPVIFSNIIRENWAGARWGAQGAGSGGGIACSNSSPLILENTITVNTAWAWDDFFPVEAVGGGISCEGSSAPRIEGNRISANVCDAWSKGLTGGGGIFVGDGASPRIVGNAIRDNRVFHDGGGLDVRSSLTVIEENLIERNTAETGVGGGIQCLLSDPVIRGNTIRDNQGDAGGGVACGWSSALIERNIIADNRSTGSGGGLYVSTSTAPVIRNNEIVRNDAGSVGGGIVSWFSDPVLSFCVIVENSAQEGGGFCLSQGSTASMSNLILRDNIAPAGPEIVVGLEGQPSSRLEIEYCDVLGGREGIPVRTGHILDWGPGNIDADPLFVSLRRFDYLLNIGSPCIDAGDPLLADGMNWPLWYPNGSRADMGIYGGPGGSGWLRSGAGVGEGEGTAIAAGGHLRARSPGPGTSRP